MHHGPGETPPLLRLSCVPPQWIQSVVPSAVRLAAAALAWASGLRVVGMEYDRVPWVSLTLMLKRGAETDPGGKAGAADEPAPPTAVM